MKFLGASKILVEVWQTRKRIQLFQGFMKGLVASKAWQEMANRYLSVRQEITNVG